MTEEFDREESLRLDYEALRGEARPKALASLKDAPWFTPDKGTFLAPILGDALMREDHYLNLSRSLSRRLLVYRDGYYQADGDSHLRKQVADRLGEKSLARRFNETAFWIETQTQCDPERANDHPGLLNLQNGMLQWETGRLLAHGPEYLSTIRIPVTYDPDATCPRVTQFLAEVLPPDCIETMLEFFGYVLIPDVRFEKAVMLTGGGANGKSTLISLLTALVGPSNASAVGLQALEENRFAVAQLEGKLLNTSADLPSKALQSGGVFKHLVTGDAYQVERKFQHGFTLRNRARLAFSANELPRSWDTSKAFFRRWLIIPFPNTFEGEAEDTDLLAKLTTPAELSGLLNLAIEGLRRLTERRRFDPPVSAREALAEYRFTSDHMLSFFEEWCTTEPEEGQRFSKLMVGKRTLYDAYIRFCQEQKIRRPDSSRRFNKRFQELYPEAEERRPKGSDRMWIGGVRLLPEYAGQRHSQGLLMEDEEADIPF